MVIFLKLATKYIYFSGILKEGKGFIRPYPHIPSETYTFRTEMKPKQDVPVFQFDLLNLKVVRNSKAGS